MTAATPPAAVRVPPPDTATLMLLDTYGLVYRAFFALPVMTTATGMPTNAAYGFTMMLNKLIADERPTHVLAAFDKGMPAERLALFAEYKAQRRAMPDDLRSQFALVRRVLGHRSITTTRPSTIAKPPSTTRPEITKRPRTTPTSRTGITCTPPRITTKRRRCTPKNTASKSRAGWVERNETHHLIWLCVVMGFAAAQPDP